MFESIEDASPKVFSFAMARGDASFENAVSSAFSNVSRRSFDARGKGRVPASKLGAVGGSIHAGADAVCVVGRSVFSAFAAPGASEDAEGARDAGAAARRSADASPDHSGPLASWGTRVRAVRSSARPRTRRRRWGARPRARGVSGARNKAWASWEIGRPQEVPRPPPCAPRRRSSARPGTRGFSRSRRSYRFPASRARSRRRRPRPRVRRAAARRLRASPRHPRRTRARRRSVCRVACPSARDSPSRVRKRRARGNVRRASRAPKASRGAGARPSRRPASASLVSSARPIGEGRVVSKGSSRGARARDAEASAAGRVLGVFQKLQEPRYDTRLLALGGRFEFRVFGRRFFRVASEPRRHSARRRKPP